MFPRCSSASIFFPIMRFPNDFHTNNGCFRVKNDMEFACKPLSNKSHALTDTFNAGIIFSNANFKYFTVLLWFLPLTVMRFLKDILLITPLWLILLDSRAHKSNSMCISNCSWRCLIMNNDTERHCESSSKVRLLQPWEGIGSGGKRWDSAGPCLQGGGVRREAWWHGSVEGQSSIIH